MSPFRSWSARTALTLLLFTLSSCAAFEPTLGARQEANFAPDREPEVAMELDLPPVAPEPPESDNVFDPRERQALRANVPAALESDETYRLELRGKPLGEAIHMIAELGGVNVYLDAGLSRRIDASFPDVGLADALRTILERNELEMVEEPEGVYWVSSRAAGDIDRAQFRVRSVNLLDIESNLRAMVDGNTAIVVDAPQNLVVVSGPRSDIEFVAEYLEAADRLKRQVLIEARIVEVMLDEGFELGLSHNFGNLDIGDNAISVMQSLTTTNNTDFSITLADDDGDVDSTISALQQYLGLELISSPRVLAVNNTEARIEVITEVPFVQTTSTTTAGGGNLGTAVFEEVQFKEAGIKMIVTPTIQEDRIIEMSIDQELSEVIDRFNGVPVIDTRRVVTRFQVEDGHTLVIGGLMQNRATKNDRGVPGLMDLPFLGRLFRSDEDNQEKRELVLFLTPHVVDSGRAETLTDTFREVYRARRREMGLEDAQGQGEASK